MNKNLKNLMITHVENENYMALLALLENKAIMNNGSLALKKKDFREQIQEEKIYLNTSAKNLAKDRIGWLLVLMVSAMLTGSILQKYEHAFSVLPMLVTFIPMLTDTGGNAGSQSSTLIIREMALKQLDFSDIFKVLAKELQVSLMVGTALSIVNFVRLYFMYPETPLVALTVVLSLFATVVFAKTIGSMLPIIAKTMNFDPAIMAAPLITTIVDALSLLTYFALASRILGI